MGCKHQPSDYITLYCAECEDEKNAADKAIAQRIAELEAENRRLREALGKERGMKDVITEMNFGEGAVTIPAKLVIRHVDNKSLMEGTKPHCVQVIVGVTVTPQPLGEHEWAWEGQEQPEAPYMQDEMWECDIIVLPKRKYHGTEMKGNSLNGILTSGGLHPDCWSQYFGPPRED